MKITVHSSKAIKPAYSGSRAGVPAVVPLTVLDEVHLGEYMSGIHAFHPPSPTSAVLEAGLARALAEYPEWAGRLVTDASTGRPVILLDDNDACGGVRFVEAAVDVDLATALPLLLPASTEVRLLHPSSDGAVELMLVQVTRFTCGSFVVGHTMHHVVGDGLGICNALLAWGQATRGAAVDPVPVHDRTSFFVPRQPPQVDFEHRGVEFSISSNASDDDEKKHLSSSSSGDDDDSYDNDDNDEHDVVEDVVTHKVHFSREFVSSLKLQAAAASAGTGRTYSTTQCVVAHLWRCMTEARRLNDDQVTTLHVAVNGRGRMRCPPVPAGYTGNVVLMAHPTTTAGDLLARPRPLSHVAELVRRAVARVDDSYFRSFIDFISSGAVEEEGLLPMSDPAECPDGEVYCLRRIPFYDLNFAGGGQQFLFIPSYSTADGLVYILPSSPLDDDGSIEAHVSLFSSAMDAFKDLCSSSKGVAA